MAVRYAQESLGYEDVKIVDHLVLARHTLVLLDVFNPFVSHRLRFAISVDRQTKEISRDDLKPHEFFEIKGYLNEKA